MSCVKDVEKQFFYIINGESKAPLELKTVCREGPPRHMIQEKDFFVRSEQDDDVIKEHDDVTYSKEIISHVPIHLSEKQDEVSHKYIYLEIRVLFF